MKLLFAIKGLVVPGGGAERVFVDVVNALVERGHRIHVATFDHDGQDLFYDLDDRIELHFLGAGEPGVPTPRSQMPKIIRGVHKLAKSIKPNAAIAFMHSTYVPVAAGLVGTGVPLIASEHTAAAHFRSRPLQKAMTRLVQLRSAAKTVVSPVIYDEHHGIWQRNLAVVPNPVDMEAFSAARGNWPDRKTLLCVGGLRPEKDQATLIAAFDRIAADFPEWRLRLVGDGTTRSAIEAQIAASAFKDRIELPGIIRDVSPEYAMATVVVMPSRYEALPMVAIEAMASGRPVVGFSDCAGAAALIEDNINGLLVTPGIEREQSLAAALRSLMSDDKRIERLGEAGPETARNYSLESVCAKWEALFERYGRT